jgi:hypothetical protein
VAAICALPLSWLALAMTYMPSPAAEIGKFLVLPMFMIDLIPASVIHEPSSQLFPWILLFVSQFAWFLLWILIAGLLPNVLKNNKSKVTS